MTRAGRASMAAGLLLLAIAWGVIAGGAWAIVPSAEINSSSSLAPSGAAGGDLSGTYPNPTVAKLAGVTPSANTLTMLDNTFAQWRTDLSLVVGTNVQAWDAELAALAGLTSAADRVPYFTGSGTAALATYTAAGRAMDGAADAAAQTALLSAATTGTAGIVKIRPVPIGMIGPLTSSYVVTNLAAAITELSSGTWRTRADLTNFTEFRLSCRQVAVAASGSELCPAYTTDTTGAAGWTHLDGTSIASACDAATGFISLSTAGNLNPTGSAWASLASAAKGDILLSLYSDDGDGAADPSFISCHLWVR